MKTVGFITLGCKVNIYESNALKNDFKANGFEIIDAAEKCDVYVINTCSVTNMADAKSRKMIRKVIKQNPDAIVCVMGCYSQTNDEALKIDGVDILIGNGNKKVVVQEVVKLLNSPKKTKYINILDILNTHDYEPLDVTTYDHTRAFVKIEDGCENFCSYCIIPYARGPVRCKPARDVIAELIRITNMGYIEVVLAGIHTGRYNDNGISLSDLIEKIIKEVPKLERLRLSSIEINEVDDKFIKLMSKYDIIANHLHLPLQSGTNKILEKMERKYDTKFFLDKINKIKSVRPDISLTTDVIVGFPYETDDDYIETKRFIEKVGFSKIHVFPYSIRKGTKAEMMPQIHDATKKSRALDLINQSKQLEKQYAEKFIGTTLNLIVEQALDDNTMVGHTSNFLQVITKLDTKLLGKNVKVQITEIKDFKVYGKIEKNM